VPMRVGGAHPDAANARVTLVGSGAAKHSS
jgi:hypothetical protein